MKILVTGGSGFIGRNIIKLLKENGNYVISLDIKDKNSISDKHIVGNVLDIDLLKKVTRDVDYVFHLAAVTSRQSLKIFSPLDSKRMF